MKDGKNYCVSRCRLFNWRYHLIHWTLRCGASADKWVGLEYFYKLHLTKVSLRFHIFCLSCPVIFSQVERNNSCAVEHTQAYLPCCGTLGCSEVYFFYFNRRFFFCWIIAPGDSLPLSIPECQWELVLLQRETHSWMVNSHHFTSDLPGL